MLGLLGPGYGAGSVGVSVSAITGGLSLGGTGGGGSILWTKGTVDGGDRQHGGDCLLGGECLRDGGVRRRASGGVARLDRGIVLVSPR